MFELDGFSGVAFGVLHFDDYRFVVAFGCNAECGFFQRFAVRVRYVFICTQLDPYLVTMLGRGDPHT